MSWLGETLKSIAPLRRKTMLKRSLNVVLTLSFIATGAHGQSMPNLEQIDTKAVMDKLDEILAATSRPATLTAVQSNTGGVNIQQGTTGADSPIINSPISVGNIQKAISIQDMVVLKKYFLDAKSKSKVQISADQFSGAVPLPDNFYDSLKGGAWTMVDAGVNHMMLFSSPGRKLQGAVVTVTGV